MQRFSKSLALMFAFQVVAALSLYAQTDYWTKKQPFGSAGPQPTGNAVSFTINGKGYLATGYNGNYPREFWEYDPELNIWTQKSDTPLPTFNYIGFSIGGKGYLGLGDFDGPPFPNPSNEFIEYDVESNSWSWTVTFPGGHRDQPITFSNESKAYISSGNDYRNGIAFSDFWEFDPQTGWSEKASLPEGAASGGFSLLNKAYVTIGSTLWQYDDATDSWIQKASIPELKYPPSLTLKILDKAYLGISEVNEWWQYDATYDQWTLISTFPVPSVVLAPFAGFSIKNKGYVVGDGLWSYDVHTRAWEKERSIGAFPRAGAVAFSIGNKGYIGTGGYWFQNQNDFWEYDQVTDRWTQKSNFPGTQRIWAVGFSIGTKGYIGLGDTLYYSPSYAKDFWEYDQAGNSWKKIADFPGLPRTSAVGFSINDKGYVGSGRYGGVQIPDVALKDFWEYNPAVNRWTQKADIGGIGRYAAIGFVIGAKGYIGGGTNNELWEYNVTVNRWNRKADLPEGISYGVGFTLYGKGYITAGSRSQSLWQYDAASNSWQKKKEFPGMVRQDASAFAIGNRAYVGIGINTFPDFLSDFWEYTPSNEPPIANGWLMKYYSPTSVLLNAWGSYDPEGRPVKFWWEKIAGPDSYTMLYQNASTPVISNLVAGSYKFQLTVTDEEGATAKDTVLLTIQHIASNNSRLSLAENAQSSIHSTQKMLIYPNPVSDMLHVKWVGTFMGPAVLTITDVAGKTIKTIPVKKSGFDFTSSLNTNELKPGLYHLKIVAQAQKPLSTHFIKL